MIESFFSFVLYIFSIGYMGYLAILAIIFLGYVLLMFGSVIVSCIKFPWTGIISYLKIRQFNHLSVLQIDDINELHNESDVFPLEKMVILRDLDISSDSWYISMISPSLNSSGRLTYNRHKIEMGQCNFITKFLLKITGFKINYKTVFNMEYKYDIVKYAGISYKEIKIPKLNKLNSMDKLRYNASMEFKKLIYENIILYQETEKFKKQHDEIDKVFKLIAESELYENQQKIYINALADLNKQLSKADELNNITHSYIKEILINVKLKTNEISGFSNNVTDKYLSIEAQHLQLKEDYEHLKNVSSNYDSLLNMVKNNK